MLLVKATRPVNLLSASFKGSPNQGIAGVIQVPAETPTQVPDDVQDEPGFKMLEDDGFIKILGEVPDQQEEGSEESEESDTGDEETEDTGEETEEK